MTKIDQSLIDRLAKCDPIEIGGVVYIRADKAGDVIRQHGVCSEIPVNTASALEMAIRYAMKVGYNYGHTDASIKQTYRDDFGTTFDLSSLREPERFYIQGALRHHKPVSIKEIRHRVTSKGGLANEDAVAAVLDAVGYPYVD